MKIKYTFFATDGTFVSATMAGEAADSGDKASNKAMSIAHKYALLQVFCIPTDDAKDPDSASPDFTKHDSKDMKKFLSAFGTAAKARGFEKDEILEYVQKIFNCRATELDENILQEITKRISESDSKETAKFNIKSLVQ